MVYQFCINLIVVSIAFILLNITGTDFSSMWDLKSIIILIISAILIFSGVVAIYFGLNVGNVSVASVVLSGRVLFVIPIGIFFLGEIYQGLIYIWIMFIVAGIIFVSWEHNFSIREVLLFKGTYYYLLADALLAFADSLIRSLHNEISFIVIILIRFIVLTSLITILGSHLSNTFNYPKIPKNIDYRFLILIFLQTLIIFIGDIGNIYALGESATLTEAIGSLQTLFVFILVLIFSRFKILKDGLNEVLDRKTLTVRIIGMILATFGTIGIALAV